MSALGNVRQNTVILAVLLTGQMILMSGSARADGGASRLERWLMRLTAPVIRLADVVGGAAGGTSGALSDLLGARRRNAVLEADLRRLTAELERYREDEEQNRRLRRLLGMRDELVPRSIAGSVVASNLSGQTRMIVVDRGTRDGVRTDLPVVAWGGAVGRVVTAEASHAKVRLITDPSSGVAAVVQRTRAQGIVVGRAGDALDLLYVPLFSDVTHGDRVVTSGLDGIFPRGFGLGCVSAVHQAPDGTQTIELVPEIDYRGLEEVLIVLEPPGAIEPPPASAEDSG